MIVLLHCRRSVPRQKWHWRSFRVTILIWPKLDNLSLTKEWVKRSGEHSLIQFLFRWNRFPFQAHMWGRGPGRKIYSTSACLIPPFLGSRRDLWSGEIFRIFLWSWIRDHRGKETKVYVWKLDTNHLAKSPLSHTGLTRAKLFWERRDFSVFSFLAVFLFLFRLFSFQFQKFWTWSW